MQLPVAIFDLDGTIFKTESIVLPAVHTAIRDLGLEEKDDVAIVPLFVYSTPELCAKLFPGLVEKEISVLSEKVRGYERSLVRTCGVLYDGIRELLAFLKGEGWEVALCTNSTEIYVEIVLRGLDLSSSFDVVRWKTDEKSKADHVRDLSVGRSVRCVIVGDRKGDIDAASQNGVTSIAVLWGYGSRAELAEATFVAPTVARLKEIFVNLKNAL
jgi:phosphoglycolate phosphatase